MYAPDDNPLLNVATRLRKSCIDFNPAIILRCPVFYTVVITSKANTVDTLRIQPQRLVCFFKVITQTAGATLNVAVQLVKNFQPVCVYLVPVYLNIGVHCQRAQHDCGDMSLDKRLDNLYFIIMKLR